MRGVSSCASIRTLDSRATETSSRRPSPQAYEDVVEQLAYDFLSDTHGGWENNDGAYGEFCFDAGARCIHLEFNERFTSSELFTHEF